MNNQKKLGASAFLPLIVFLALYVGCGITFTLMGVSSPFGQFPRHVALLAGIAAALLLAPGVKVGEKLDVFCENMGNSGVMMIVLIYLMAGGFQGAAAAMGGKDSVINLALHFIPVTLLIPGVFLMCCFISTAIIAMVIYTALGGQGSGVIEAGSYNVIQVLPYIVVLATALMGINVAVVLFVGILMTGVIGLAQGTVGFFAWIQAIGGGMSDMFSISIVAILISGIIGLVRYYGGVEWLVSAITTKIRSRRSAEYGIGLLSGVLSAALVNNTIGIIVTCPIAKEIGSKYGIAPKRLASLVDIFACAFLALMPHDGGILIVTELAGCTPLEVLPYSFYMFALIIFTCVTIHFGLLRTPEEKAAAKQEASAR